MTEKIYTKRLNEKEKKIPDIGIYDMTRYMIPDHLRLRLIRQKD